MAFDPGLAERVREVLESQPGLSEKQMFGGLAFLLHGHICCGVLGEELMVRVGTERQAEALRRPHARPMDFTGRPLSGFVYVGAPGLESDEGLAGWVALGAKTASALPPKRPKEPRATKTRRPPEGGKAGSAATPRPRAPRPRR